MLFRSPGQLDLHDVPMHQIGGRTVGPHPHHVAETSKYITFYPGDVMWMGTDGTSPDLVHGDVVEVELTGLGVLRNRFVKAGM